MSDAQDATQRIRTKLETTPKIQVTKIPSLLITAFYH